MDDIRHPKEDADSYISKISMSTRTDFLVASIFFSKMARIAFQYPYRRHGSRSAGMRHGPDLVKVPTGMTVNLAYSRGATSVDHH